MGFGLATPKTTFEVQPGIAHCQTTSKGCCCLYDLYGAGAEATSNFSEKWRLLAHSHNSFNDFSIIYIYIFNLKKSAGSLSAGAFKHRNHGWVCQNGAPSKWLLKRRWGPWPCLDSKSIMAMAGKFHEI